MDRQDFWNEAFRLQGSVTPYVVRRVIFFTMFSVLVCVVFRYFPVHWGMEVAPYEIVGVVLALLLMQRTGAGYDRWYEGRKLWGGIVNQSRNLGLIGRLYGPQESEWQDRFARWTAAFSHICRHSLRGERKLEDMYELLGEDDAQQLAKARHMPSYVAGRIGNMMRQATDAGTMDRFAFLQGEHERATLIDHIGACERILRTPLALVFSIKIRRFLFLYLMVLPIALVDKTGLATPWIVLVVSYPLLSLDQIGIEMQNPFAKERLGHLPLDDISNNIQGDVLAYSTNEPVLSLEVNRPTTNGHDALVRVSETPLTLRHVVE